MIAVDGQDGSAVVFVDDAIDATSAVRAFDLVFARAEPRILGVQKLPDSTVAFSQLLVILI